MREGARLFSSFSFWLDKAMLYFGNNFWSDFLHSIVLVVKAFQHQEMQFLPHRNMQQGQRLLTICWTAWIVLPWVLYYPWSCSLFPASQSTAYMLTLSLYWPPPRWAHVRQQKNNKNGKQPCWAAKEASKSFCGYLQAGLSSKSYTVHLSWNE